MKKQNEIARQMILRTGSHAGPHKNRLFKIRKGQSRKTKHKKQDDATRRSVEKED